MARAQNAVPAYRLHKPSGQAYVRVPDGSGGRRFVYLGPYNSPESKEEYARICVRRAEGGGPAGSTVGPRTGKGGDTPTVAELLLAFLRHAGRHYRRPDGTVTNEYTEFRLVSRSLRELYAATPADEFGPLALKSVRQRMVDAGLSRGTVNARVRRIKHVFKWAVAEEMVPATVHHSLTAVTGLRQGRTEAPEPEPVEPVDRGDVEAVQPFVRPEVAAMIRVQLATGMRPGEVCLMRPTDIDRSGPVWVYRPAHHKLGHRGKSRAVAVGPKAQRVLAAFWPADESDYFFSPRRAVRGLHAERSGKRVTRRFTIADHHIGVRLLHAAVATEVTFTAVEFDSCAGC